MPDWVSFVAARMGHTGLPPVREQEIVEELAAHLEDTEEEGTACEQVRDWPELARRIRVAEEDSMKTRLWTLWIPGLISGVLAALALTVIQKTSFRPVVTSSELQPMVFYYPWFFVLPPVGAIAAYLCRRAGGSVRLRLVVAAFPCLGLLAPLILSGIFAIGATLFTGESTTRLVLMILQFITVWGILPAAALLVGAVPFLGGPKAVAAEPPDAAHA